MLLKRPISGGQFFFQRNDSREDYNNRIKNLRILEGPTGRYLLLDGIWVKEMHPFRIGQGKVRRADFKKIQLDKRSEKVLMALLHDGGFKPLFDSQLFLLLAFGPAF